jgi:acetylornithine aminotransferase/acetylornithine/N-succinyldiaminopimelate aminotransferase
MKREGNVQRPASNSESFREPAVQRSIQTLFEKFVLPTYARFDLVLERGEGSYVWDVNGRRYLDFGAGIAVCALGHGNSEIADALSEQARKLVHVSNLYYTEVQACLAKRMVDLIGPGRVFFCNSGAEANEGLFKLARRFGHREGRYEIITAHESFHGRTLAGIAATGQEKVKKGFEPMVAGFRQVPFNDFEAMRAAITESTAAILVEAIQGESGIAPATVEYLLGLRSLCDKCNLLLFIDEVQAGYFRTGKFHAWQRILEDQHRDFLPDGISMAKGLGGGFPIGGFWVREKFATVLGPGTHASTFGGTPLACAVALRVLDVIQRDDLAANTRRVGDLLMQKLKELQEQFPTILREVRGVGLMIGIEFDPRFKAVDIVNRLHRKNLLTVPAGDSVVRLLPPLNLSEHEAEEGLHALGAMIADLAKP